MAASYYHKNPFRHFDHNTAKSKMMKYVGSVLGKDYLEGSNRKRMMGKILYFDTYDSLSDPVNYFAEAMTIELEHGKVGTQAGVNVTNDDVDATARIAAAHILGVEYGDDDEGGTQNAKRPFGDYYDFLIWMEYMHYQVLMADV